MTDEVPIEEPDETEDCLALTPGGRERLAANMKRLRQALAPQVSFKFLQIGRPVELAPGMTKLPTLTFPEAAFKNMPVLSIFASQQAKFFDAFRLAPRHQRLGRNTSRSSIVTSSRARRSGR